METVTTKTSRLDVRWILLAFIAAFCSLRVQAADMPQAVEAEHGAVVSVSESGSKVGLAILKRGGNAVDAAVAVALTMAVTYPQAGNIGGGGFMMVHPEPGCVEYREIAPATATKTMFSLGDSQLGHKIVGVPGTVRGLALAHQQFGKLPWKDLVLPAVNLAEKGFAIDQAIAETLNAVLENQDSKPFTEMLRVFAPPKCDRWRAGDLLIQPDLTCTLQLIAFNGPNAFYTGCIADQIVAEMKSGGGLITNADLAGYRATIRKPIHGTYRGYDVYGPPPPSSGGICLVQMLNILEIFNLRQRGHWSAETLHLMIEAMRRAYLDRARHLGDLDFVKIPPHLTTKKYASTLAKQIEINKATPSEDLAKDIPISGEGTSTTHFSVIDSTGMGVSNTYTLEHSYGPRRGIFA